MSGIDSERFAKVSTGLLQMTQTCCHVASGQFGKKFNLVRLRTNYQMEQKSWKHTQRTTDMTFEEEKDREGNVVGHKVVRAIGGGDDNQDASDD